MSEATVCLILRLCKESALFLWILLHAHVLWRSSKWSMGVGLVDLKQLQCSTIDRVLAPKLDKMFISGKEGVGLETLTNDQRPFYNSFAWRIWHCTKSHRPFECFTNEKCELRNDLKLNII